QVAHLPPGETLARGTNAELAEHAVDPRRLFFGTEAAPFNGDEVIHWTSALDVRARGGVLVPAQEVWFGAPEAVGEPRLVALTTSGSALGGSPEEAAIFALFEAVERDAYLTMWYTRRSCARIDPDSVRNEGFQLLRRRWALAYPGYEFALFDATTDVAIPTVVAIAARRRGTGRMTFHAAATRLSVEGACLAALKDLGGFTPHLSAAQRAELVPLLAEPWRVTGPEGHFGLYSLDETHDRLAFLDLGVAPMLDARDAAPGAWFPARPRYDLRALLEESAERMHPLGASLLLKTITHPEMESRGVHCVRAITPGLFPMWFGEHGRRFAVTERLRRLGRDLAGRELTEPADFNLQLHPFS
ncbi:MAG TPA: YcaO-like family protein, partial [Longimicrobium sp.]